MRRAKAFTGIRVEVFVEEDVVAPVRVGLKFLVRAEDGAAALRVAGEDVDEPLGETAGKLVEVDGCLVLGVAGDGELPAVGLPQLAQRLDHHEVHREPNRPAPIRVPALELHDGFGRLVADAAVAQGVGMLLVVLRETSQAVG